jgi:phosphoenolpyruvate carboxykinase (ATP)
MLGERLAKHKVNAWLVNTGWTGGPYGVGNRMKIAFTRQMIHAILNGLLDEVPTVQDPLFGLYVPESCPGVPKEVMNQRDTWTDKHAFDGKAKELAEKFKANFEQFAGSVSAEVGAAGPK